MSGYASVCFPIPVKQAFTYEVPDSLVPDVRPGVRVLVSFGHRKRVGFITDLLSKSGLAVVKPVLDVLNPEILLPKPILSLAGWIAAYYMCGQGEALEIFFPPPVDRKKIEIIHITENGCSFIKNGLITGGGVSEKRRVLEKIISLSSPGKKTVESFLKKEGLRVSLLNLLVKDGLITISPEIAVKRVQKREAWKKNKTDCFPELTLSESQRKAVSLVSGAIGKGEFKTFLLHGVTGSGKSEVYLRCTEFAVTRGKQVIILVPEIGLTYQTVSRFHDRFGDKVSIIHSALTPVNRYNEWKRIRFGEVSVVIGARSAVLAPFSRLGLVIVDEEHDSAYKQEDAPRYNGRDVAVYRGCAEGAVVLLGSATPSLETHFNVLKGKYTRITLPDRIDNRTLPKAEVIDMKGNGANGILSETLRFKIEERNKMEEQTLLFLNRRGSSTFVHCVTCGFVWKCRNCDISLTFYKKKGVLSCNYCGYECFPDAKCPSCNGKKIEYKGFGTQKIEEEVQKIFPESRLVRIDRDSTGKKGQLEAILNKVRKREVDILVGTQMISKGHDFPDITLVGIISADNMVNIPDFRAGEKTFQQIVQVAGRGGRGKKRGEVFLQTYKPDHYAIRLAMSHDLPEFYRQELLLRKELNYPPYSRLVSVRVEGRNEFNVHSESRRVKEELKDLLGDYRGVEILGPAKAVLYKIQNRFRVHLLLKGEFNSTVRKGIDRVTRSGRQNSASAKGAKIIVDVDPVNLL